MRRSKTTLLRVVDTNVPITANLANRPNEIPPCVRIVVVGRKKK